MFFSSSCCYVFFPVLWILLTLLILIPFLNLSILTLLSIDPSFCLFMFLFVCLNRVLLFLFLFFSFLFSFSSSSCCGVLVAPEVLPPVVAALIAVIAVVIAVVVVIVVVAVEVVEVRPSYQAPLTFDV